MLQNPPSPVPGQLQTWHEPEHYQEFRCLGDACEDTCCSGWGVAVDRDTYGLYQQSKHPEFGSKLQQLVTINAAPTPNSYATITLNDAECPFLAEQLCGVHKELGEDHLGHACATFPRVVNQVDGAIERSLDLSCPEAARITLLNPQPDFFQEFSGPAGFVDGRLIAITQGRQNPPRPEYFDQVRSFAISILQNRSYPVAKRLMLLGYFCAKLNDLAESGTQHLTLQVLDGFRFAIDSRLFDEHLHQTSAEPASQLSIVLELVVGRVSLDYTSRRYRDLYRDFMQGLELKSNSTIPELADRYSDAYFQYYAPFMERREHILEHYLVSYAYKNLFPFGSGSISNQYMVLASYFAITRALAVGLAGHYRSSFDEDHVVRAIQVCARALEHCTSFPARVLEILASKGILIPAAMSVLTQNLTQPAWAHDGFVTRRMKASA